MNILVTGGAGFIGSNLVRHLLKEGHSVTVYDDFSTGHENNLSGVDVPVIRDTVSNFDAHDVSNMDAIIHLGMPSTMMLYRNESVRCIQEACLGMHKILEACRLHGCKLVFASSSSVYNGLDLPHTEDREILIKDFYTEGRVFMERMAVLYDDLYGIPSIGFRFFAVYGPREEAKQGYANMISQFLWNLLEDVQPTVFGDGTQKRDFTHVRDVTRILTQAATEEMKGAEIYNIGTAHNYSFNDIIQVINEELGKEIKPVYIDNPIRNYVHTLLADVTKLNERFGPAQVDLRTGIRELIEYYKSESAPPSMENPEQYYISTVQTKDPS